LKNRAMNLDGSIPAVQSEAGKRGRDRTQTTHKLQSVASWRSLTVLRLGCQGLSPQDIIRETGIPRSTVYQYYWNWFGKRRAQIARRKQAVENLVQMWERDHVEPERL